MIDYLFLFISVLLAFIGWHTPFRWVSIALVADFCAYMGFDAYMLSEKFINLVGYDQMYYLFMPLKGTIAMIFFMIYININLYLNKSGASPVIALNLAALSALSGLFHFFVAYLQYKGIYISGYEFIMTIYCILQLTVLLGGITYEYVHRNSPHNPGDNHHLHHH